ncbi:MAG TPA: MBOAT family O-acyltransferase [Bacteroidia bacterium]|nr:MBOAT family O-acyltransferase [Bacteroidia bacterium]HRS59349.1 MBOAT family O-acyltransferase [Bacteroidia bacterium]HRU67219.1 MBOAT family O-acyltransferase [Bacteroidia bacterium]
MYFNSITYLVFVAAIFFFYWQIIPKKKNFQNALLLLSGYIFYAFFDYRFCFLIFAMSVSDYLLALKISSLESKIRRKTLMWLSILINTSILLLFRSMGFFTEQFALFLSQLGFEVSVQSLKLIVPVGLSFYTLKSLGYVIDVTKNRFQAEKSLINYLLFVSFFPQLTSGPIDRAANLLHQINITRVFDYQVVVAGFRLILLGLFKKIVLADNLAPIVNDLFGQPQSENGFLVVLAALLFALQLYFDFSAYTDVAIGTSRLFGLFSMENFRKPYFSLSISQFWSKWHISLSTWFRDYVFLPLAFWIGKRIRNQYFLGISSDLFIYSLAVMVTFALTGLWHGLGLNFLLWGLVFAFLLMAERSTAKFFRNIRKTLRKNHLIKIYQLFSGLFVFLLVCLNWIFFRSGNVNQAFTMFNTLFTKPWHTGGEHLNGHSFNPGIVSALLVILLAEILSGKKNVEDKAGELKWPFRWGFYFLLLFFILFFGAFDLEQGFIYSNF